MSYFDDKGYVYIPNSCKANECSVHTVLHGCGGGAAYLGTAFIENAGYLEWATTNNITLLFPQIKKTAFPDIPYQGCWDVFGYTGENYALSDGIQPQAL